MRKEPGDYGAWAIHAHLWHKAGYDEWAHYYYKKFQCEHAEKQDARYGRLARWADRQLAALPKTSARIDCANPPVREVDTRTQTFLANELASIGRYREAVALLDSAIAHEPDNIELLLSRARYQQRAGYWAGRFGETEDKNRFDAGAREDFAKLLKLADQNPPYKSIIYLWWSFLGPELGALDNDQRRAFLEESIKAGPADAGTLAALSDYAADSDPHKAIAFLRRSVGLSPSAENYHKLAALQNKTGDHRDALNSINLAIALASDDPSHYEERERIEAGLGVGRIDRARHLADGYSRIGDRQLTQQKKAEAYQTYGKALQTLSTVAGADASGAVANDIAAVKSKIARVLDANREKTSARILSMKEGDGKTREVVIDRGTDDGVVAAEEGSLWSIYSKVDDKERKVQRIGVARILSVDKNTATVRVTMDDPTGDKLVRVGDMVEVGMRVPPLGDRPNPRLWDLMKFHVALTSEDGQKVIADYRMLYQDASPETVNRVVDEIVAEIKSTAARLSTIDLMKTVIKKGRYKDKTLLQVMQNATRADVQGMLDDMWQYPATHYGQDVKVARAFAGWVLGEPE